MLLKLIVLFFTPFLSGLLIYLVPQGRKKNFRLLLVFAGSYLFAITVSHILPELYRQYGDVKWVGIFVLAGFFLQQVLEYFTSGVEHGHIHADENHDHQHDHAHHHHANHNHKLSAFVLLLALCIHAFLEGAMLTQPEVGEVYNANAVLLGIVLHRTPAAFALMTVLSDQLGSIRRALPYLIWFSSAAPLGLLLSHYLSSHALITSDGLIFLYALVCGNFLYISTTIVFESSPEHRFNAMKLIVALLGALLAVGMETLF
ncbi:MAG TPA: ZIP family metal transporter [Cyclobacteriaceae bacterium]|nr:ZIP family metal transporter [Cyclobacteriaceae bacterium]